MGNKVFFTRVAFLSLLLGMSLLCAEAQVNGQMKRARLRAAVSSTAQTMDDMASIRRVVKEKFASWCKKGEFEKAAAVDERLRTDSKVAFDKICFDAILKQISKKVSQVSSAERMISTYDSEKETFEVTVSVLGIIQQFSLNVPIDVAPQFKADFPFLPLSFGSQWGVLNGKLYPKSIKFDDYDMGFSCEVPIASDGMKDVEISFDGMGISNLYLSGHVFSLSEYMQQDSELLKEFSFHQDNSKLFDVVEQMPSYPGGNGAMMAFISSHVKYPDGNYCAQGRVIVSFVVERDGSLSSFKVLRSVEEHFDKEAIRVVKSMPKWKPGRQNGKVVRCKYIVPVAFRLQ